MWYAKTSLVSNDSYFVSVDNEEEIIITDDEDDEEEVSSLFSVYISTHCHARQSRQVTRIKKCLFEARLLPNRGPAAWGTQESPLGT